MTQNTIYPSARGNASTTLTNTYTARTSVIIEVADGSRLPVAPNVITISDPDTPAEKYAVVAYATLTNNTVSGLTVIDAVPDSDPSFTAGAIVARNITGHEWDTIKDHIDARDNPHMITISQIGAAAEDHTHTPTEAGAAPATHAAQHGVAGTDPINIDAGQMVSGVLDIARIPATAIERVVVVADDAARYALTPADVQLGDTVKVNATAKMWAVIDTAQLGTDAGYIEYTASAAWPNITNKPLTYPPTPHALQHAIGGGDSISPQDIGASPDGHTHTPGDIGAADRNHTHTPASIGAATAGHTHTPVSIGAADRAHTHTADDVGAAAANHTHTPDDIGAAAAAHTHTAADVGAAPARHKSQHATGGADALTPADIGASATGHTHTPASIGAAAENHAGTHAIAGSDPISPVTIGAADRAHALQHAANGDDPITPASIGAAATAHLHTGYAAKIHSEDHATGGADELTPADIGAATAGHTHTGYAASIHAGQHHAGGIDPITPASINAAAAAHTHTPAEAGAAAEEHTHTAADLSPAIDGTSIYINSSGKLEAAAGSEAPPASSITYENQQSGLLASDVQGAIDEIASGTVTQQQADWTQTNEAAVTYIKNKPVAMPPTAHAATHAYGGADELTPADIGAATAGHTHTGYAASIHAEQHATGGADELTPADIGAATAIHTHTPASIGAAPINHTHTPGDIGAAAEEHTHTAADLSPAIDGTTILINGAGKLEAQGTGAHAATHAIAGSDPISPVTIGAADRAHTHTAADVGAAPAKHKSQHATGGADALTPADIGASATGHTHTPASIGAATAEHTHTPVSIGAADRTHTHTPAEAGAAAEEHTHTAADLSPAIDGTTILINGAGKLEAQGSGAHAATHAIAGSDPISIDASQITSGTLDSDRLPNLIPEPVIVATPGTGANWNTVAFSYTNAGGTAYDQLWDFGDGETSTSATPSHTYTTDVHQQATDYTVTLTVTGKVAAASTTATVTTTFPYPIYGFKIIYAETGPTNKIEYLGDAVGNAPMTKTNDGDWAEWCNHILNPCLLALGAANHAAVTYLDKTDLAKDTSGNAVSLTGSAGDVMVEIRRLYIETTADSSGDINVYISEGKPTDAWLPLAHQFGDAVKQYLYVGMFKAIVSNSVMTSVHSTAASTGSMTHDAFRGTTIAAQKGSDTYGIINYNDRTLVNILMTLFFRRTDFQQHVGNGNSNSNNFIGTATGLSLTGGKNQGDTSGTATGVSCLWFKDWWGEKWESIDGLTLVYPSTWWLNRTNKDFVTQASLPAQAPANYEVITLTMPSASNSGIKAVHGHPRLIFVPKEIGGDTSVNFCDCCSSSSGTKTLYCGGRRSDAALAGPFTFNVYNAVGSSFEAEDARLRAVLVAE